MKLAATPVRVSGDSARERHPTAAEELENLLREVSIRGRTQEAVVPGFDSEPSPSFDSGQFDLAIDPFTPPPSADNVPLMDPGAAGLPPYSGGQLISLGLFEQLPSFDIIDDLTALYFQTVHDGAPMLHQASYTLALRFPPPMRPPMCLQYIVMALAAAMSDIYRHLSEPFYQRARVYAEADEMRAPGEIFATVAHAQCWCLIAAYECHVYAMYTRASTSLCRSVRIAQMLGLHRLDSQEPEPLRSGPPPPRNWTEAEERRRTWWSIFLADCYFTAVTGWPSLIDVRHIRTNLPTTEERFNNSMGEGDSSDEETVSFSHGLDALRQGLGAGRVSPLAVRILAANELLRVLDHTTNSPPPAAPVSGLEEKFHQPEDTTANWEKRLLQIDDNLVTLATALPERLNTSLNPYSLDAIVVHTCTHIAAVHLHRAALQRHYLCFFQHNRRSHRHGDWPGYHPAGTVAHSRSRLLSAAEGLLAVFRAAAGFLGAALQNPLLPFAAYLAASVFLEDHLRTERAATMSVPGEGRGGGERGGERGGGGGEGEGGGGGGRGDTSIETETGMFGDERHVWETRAQTRQYQQSNEEKLGYLARILVLYGRINPLVRANAARLAEDMRRSGYDASAMEQTLGPLETWGGGEDAAAGGGNSTAGGGMTFCPPVASAPGPVGVNMDLGEGGLAPGGGQGLGNGLAASGYSHHSGGFPVLSFRGLAKSGPCTPNSTVVPSMLKVGTSKGLFSKIVQDDRGIGALF
ncbi:hypothetical protein VTH82DRAFT_6967 [Thermothelomyces myriococcoides]